MRARFKAVHGALSADHAEAVCVNSGEGGCKAGTYAYVFRDEPYRIYLCAPFHGLPAMFDMAESAPQMENGTREGTIIHEMSHFVVVAGTEDACYARSVCRDMAARDPFSAILNADSLQYFAEDVAYLPPPELAPGLRTGRARRP